MGAKRRRIVEREKKKEQGRKTTRSGHESKTVAVYGRFYGVTHDYAAIIIYPDDRNWLPFNRHSPRILDSFNDSQLGRGRRLE